MEQSAARDAVGDELDFLANLDVMAIAVEDGLLVHVQNMAPIGDKVFDLNQMTSKGIGRMNCCKHGQIRTLSRPYAQ